MAKKNNGATIEERNVTAENNPEAFIALQIARKAELAKEQAAERVRKQYESPEAKQRLLKEASLAPLQEAVLTAERALEAFDAEYEPERIILVDSVNEAKEKANAVAKELGLGILYGIRGKGRITTEVVKETIAANGGRATALQIATAAGVTNQQGVQRWFDKHGEAEGVASRLEHRPGKKDVTVFFFAVAPDEAVAA